jgi:hypothetical protein
MRLKPSETGKVANKFSMMSKHSKSKDFRNRGIISPQVRLRDWGMRLRMTIK